MNSNHKTKSKKSPSLKNANKLKTKRRWIGVLFVVVFGGLGVALLIRSFAASGVIFGVSEFQANGSVNAAICSTSTTSTSPPPCSATEPANASKKNTSVVEVTPATTSAAVFTSSSKTMSAGTYQVCVNALAINGTVSGKLTVNVHPTGGGGSGKSAAYTLLSKTTYDANTCVAGVVFTTASPIAVVTVTNTGPGILHIGSIILTNQTPPPPSLDPTFQVDPNNKRYFMDANGKAVYMTGYHTEQNQIDQGTTNPPAAYNFTNYLNNLVTTHSNFIRLWTWENSYLIKGSGEHDFLAPLPYKTVSTRTYTDPTTNAKAQIPVFDLTNYNSDYFTRLHDRVAAAKAKGIYVDVMLFQGWSAWNYSKSSTAVPRDAWDFDPYNKNNNVNGINGDPNNTGEGGETHSLDIPAITNLQENYVKHVITTLADLNNVTYEISNESKSSSNDWQKHMVNFINNIEANQGLQQPVGMTSFSDQQNALLMSGPADWVSLQSIDFNSASDIYISHPPVTDGSKVQILDTDHLGYGLLSQSAKLTRQWFWKTFLRGYNPIMLEDNPTGPGLTEGEKDIKYTSQYAARLDLDHTTPSNDWSNGGVSSTDYALVNPGKSYLVYQSNSGSFSFKAATGTYSYEWFNPVSGSVVASGSKTITTATTTMTPPFSGEAVLFLHQ